MVYDLIVIGGGPAGYLAAERAGHEDMSVLLVEKRKVGGVCLNEGCVPSKSLLYSAKILEGARHGADYGVRCDNVSLDHAAVVARKNRVVNTLVTGVKGQLKRNKVTVAEGVAEILTKTAEGFVVAVKPASGPDGAGTENVGKRLLVATGSAPVVPPIPGVKEGLEAGFVLTNREILDLDSVPATLAVIGGGVIGLEMASYFASAGSKVTVIEMLDHIAGPTDGEISKILLANYKKRGIAFELGAKVVSVGGGEVKYEKGDQTLAVKAEKVLLSIGRRPVTEGLGLERIGVLTERGAIKTDSRGKTNVADVYAAGDVNGVSMLAHTAYREAEVCVNVMAGRRDSMRYGAIPAVIYSNPEVGSVGETEESAKAKGLEYECAKVSMMFSGRYVAENESGDGICKVLVDKKTRAVIGAHMIGNYSSEIIYGAALMVETEMVVNDIKEMVFPHPTVSEVIREAIFSL